MSILSEIRDDNVVIFTDDFMQRSGAVDKVSSYIKNCGKIHVFADIIPDPPIELIVKALSYLEKKKADLVVALGGGSSIDAAKATILMYQKKTGKKLPLYAIP
ncbi:MAG: iron-containing alcohol dehydrogenase, partial [Clostridia bacterium]|nr:iron-containing alcohol dehydrogenase [Clostridia bacterium]